MNFLSKKIFSYTIHLDIKKTILLTIVWNSLFFNLWNFAIVSIKGRKYSIDLLNSQKKLKKWN